MASIFTNKNYRIEQLARVSIFANLPKKELQVIESYVTPTRIAEGEQLTTQGRAANQLVLLVTGEAKVMRNKRKVAMIGPGEAIGELSLLDGDVQTATVVTTMESEALVVPVNQFQTMLADSPTFARNLLKSVAKKMRASMS